MGSFREFLAKKLKNSMNKNSDEPVNGFIDAIDNNISNLSENATLAQDAITLKQLLLAGKPVLINKTITISENIEIPLDIPLYLDGQGKGKIKFTGTGVFLKVNRSRRAILMNLEIEGNGQFNNQTAIVFSSPNDSNLSEGSNNVLIQNNIITNIGEALLVNTLYNSVIKGNRINKARKGMIFRGKCTENSIESNTVLVSSCALSLEKSASISYTANGFFPEGQYFMNNTFDIYSHEDEPEKENASTFYIESGYDIRFIGNYIANLNASYGKLMTIKLNEVKYNQLFYIMFNGNGIHGDEIAILDAKTNALYPYNILFNGNQINFNKIGKFNFNKANFVKVISNTIKVDHTNRIADILNSNNIDFNENTIYYGNSDNPTNVSDTIINVDTSDNINIQNNNIIYAYKTVSNLIITEKNCRSVINLNNKYKDKVNSTVVTLANGGKVHFWRHGDIVIGSVYTNTEIFKDDTEITPYPLGFKPTNGMNGNSEYPIVNGEAKIALTNTGLKFFGKSVSYMRCSFFYISQ